MTRTRTREPSGNVVVSRPKSSMNTTRAPIVRAPALNGPKLAVTSSPRYSGPWLPVSSTPLAWLDEAAKDRRMAPSKTSVSAPVSVRVKASWSPVRRTCNCTPRESAAFGLPLLSGLTTRTRATPFSSSVTVGTPVSSMNEIAAVSTRARAGATLSCESTRASKSSPGPACKRPSPKLGEPAPSRSIEPS